MSGEDGPSQMALEDFAMFRTIPGAACFYPCDAVSTERAMELAANYKGLTFTRTSRPATAVIYKNDEEFEIGKGKVGGGKWSHSCSCCICSTQSGNLCNLRIRRLRVNLQIAHAICTQSADCAKSLATQSENLPYLPACSGIAIIMTVIEPI